MLTHRGFSAWIVVDGKPLPEYLVALNEISNQVSCWIPSEEGKAFSIYWRDHGGKIETCSYITLDGFLAPGRFLYGDGTASRGGVRTGPTSERPFVFQKVTEDCADFEDSSQGNKDVGTIVLRIKRVKFGQSAPPNSIQQLPPIHRGKNGMRIGFGDEQSTYEQYPSTWKVEPYDNPSHRTPKTYVSFVFRYRSLEFLKAQSIIDEVANSTTSKEPRRSVSMPLVPPDVAITPCPSPPHTNARQTNGPVYYRMASQRLKHSNTDNRRATSRRASCEPEERPANYPGEGLIIIPYREANSPDVDSDHANAANTATTLSPYDNSTAESSATLFNPLQTEQEPPSRTTQEFKFIQMK